jgi:hypothetical protein
LLRRVEKWERSLSRGKEEKVVSRRGLKKVGGELKELR